MRIAIASDENKGLQSKVAQHFGRCPYYIFVTIEDDVIKETTAVENPYHAAHEAGMVPAFIHQQQADVMIAGGMGRRAIQFFTEYGIKTATGAAGTVQEVLNAYQQGYLADDSACKESIDHSH
jgi:predicted Fe-Mo cluster-binding NifX family protein